MKQLLTLAAISCTTIALTACGDENVTNINENAGVQSFESMKKFPDCTKDNQGEMAIATKEGLVYYCDDEKWKKLNGEPGKDGENWKNGADGKDGQNGENGSDGKDGKEGKDGTSCIAQETTKGIEVSCGGKVVGTLTNGKDGKDGEAGSSCVANKVKDGIELKCGGIVIDTLKNGEKGDSGVQGEKGEKGESCKVVALSDSSYNIICGNDIITVKNGSVTQVSGGNENLPVKNKNISGVAQKGPFVVGGDVSVHELDGKMLAQTGKSFVGNIKNNKGEFNISDINLSSQYALFRVKGYFYNEVNGQKSNAPITLNALTDLSDRETVNINLLTHLEYERAKYLVSEGKTVAEAKKQAQSEIFNAFYITGDFSNSEDLNIFASGEGNAALLAMSVLMQADLSEASETTLLECLTNFVSDFKVDGKWDDNATAAKMADWAESANLAKIRTNIENWNLGSVPDFEKIVKRFWYKNYGLDECTNERSGEVLAVTNEHSEKYNTQIRYICKDNAWVVATDIEKDTYQWDKGEDGEIKLGDVTKSVKYVYDGVDAEWRYATDLESSLDGDCTEKREGETVFVQDSVYKCKEQNWEKLGYWNLTKPKEEYLNSSINYGTMTDDRDKQIYKTVVIGTQTWMAENLNYKTGNSYCYYNDENLCKVAGRLYTWAAAIDSVALAANGLICGYSVTCDLPEKVQGVCPSGWHLPDTTEWNSLRTFIGANAGKKLKSKEGWYNNNNGLDTYGFSALPAGGYDDSGFGTVGYGAYFWSATEGNSYNAYYVYLYCIYDSLISRNYSKYNAYSVRCLMDPN